MIGYAQVSADGAAYVAQHVGDQFSDGFATSTAIYPTIQTSDLSQSAHPSVASVGRTVDYGYGSPTNRHGGAAVTGAVPVEVVVRHSMNFVLPFTQQFFGTMLQGDAVSQHESEEGPGWNVSGSITPDAKLKSAAGYHTTNDYTPPYFLARNYLIRCSDPFPWTQCGTTTEYAYSSAEYLDNDNWARPDSGVQPAPTATFYEIPCHQRRLAAWAAKLPQTLPTAGTAARTTLTNLFNPKGLAVPDADMAVIRGWEVSQQILVGQSANPLAPAAGC